MHKKHAKDGLVIISVSIDSADDKADAEKFLRSKGASFTNLILDEPAEVFQRKLRFSATPCYYVFSRNGRWTQFRGEEQAIDYRAMDRLIEELLQEH
jgi:hypothetical protein